MNHLNFNTKVALSTITRFAKMYVSRSSCLEVTCKPAKFIKKNWFTLKTKVKDIYDWLKVDGLTSSLICKCIPKRRS